MELTNHVSAQFNNELITLRNNILVMGGVVEQQLKVALRALYSQDGELARQVVETDRAVNKMETDIVEACTLVLAKRQPTASDLRFIQMVIKTSSDLELIGNTARKIARLNRKASGLQSLSSSYLNGIAFLANGMLHRVLDAFARMDVHEAICIYRDDDKIDEQYELLIRNLIEHMMNEPRSIPQVVEIIKCAHAIERVGDRCQNISDYIIYYLEGKDRRHGTQIIDQ